MAPHGATSLTIRPLDEADHAVWMEFWRGYQAFYKADIADGVSAVTWGRLHDLSEPMWGALAIDDDTPVGLVHWLVHRSTWTTGDYCYLQDLFVSPAARGKGAGRRLIEHVYLAARNKGCSSVYWMTQKTNVTAMKLYDTVSSQTEFVQYRTVL